MTANANYREKTPMKRLTLLALALLTSAAFAEDKKKITLSKDELKGVGKGWRAMDKDDFVNVNCDKDTWQWKTDLLHCTGKPVGVLRSKKQYTNFSLVLEWRHLKYAGNSGVFVWAPEGPLMKLKRNQLPQGIEAQVLDHGYAENWSKKNKGKKPNWFTTNGDVFPTGKSKMKPFPPFAPNKRRSFPSKNTTKGSPNWNHYHIRCVDGEIRLWVNGVEVSGGSNCEPATGYICLESEGSPIDFKNIRIRVHK